MARNLTINLHEGSFESYNCDTPSLDVEITKDELVHMYKSMVTMRRMEMASDGLYKAKLIRGFCHLCTGQVMIYAFSYKCIQRQIERNSRESKMQLNGAMDELC